MGERTARQIVGLIASGAKELAAELDRSGLVEGTAEDGTWKVSCSTLSALFGQHAVVMQGDLPRALWPRFYRKSGSEAPVLLCTCSCFVLRAECEHVVFVSALQGRCNLSALPTHRAKGRPRKRRLPVAASRAASSSASKRPRASPGA